MALEALLLGLFYFSTSHGGKKEGQMNKVLLIVLALVLVFATQASFVQAGSAPTTTFSIYYIGTIPLEKDPAIVPFLKNINAEKPVDQAYLNTPLNKASDGVLNTVTSWVEIPSNVVKTSDEYSILAGLTVGFGQGLVSGFARGVSGVYDISTATVSPYGKPLMQPNYQVDSPQQGWKIALLRW